MTTVYIAGPMRGIPDFNYPAFDEAAGRLRAKGYSVINPAEMDREVAGPEGYKSATGDVADVPEFDIRTTLAKDIAAIAERVDVIAFLPGWEHSKGALAEATFADAVGILVTSVGSLL